MFWGPRGCGCMMPIMLIMLLGALMMMSKMCSGPWWY